MTRRDFFQRLAPRPEHTEQTLPHGDEAQVLRDLFLQAMAIGIDPASYTPEALREKLAEHAPSNSE